MWLGGPASRRFLAPTCGDGTAPEAQGRPGGAIMLLSKCKGNFSQQGLSTLPWHLQNKLSSPLELRKVSQPEAWPQAAWKLAKSQGHLQLQNRSKAQICQATLQEVGVRSKTGSADISSWAAREILWAHGAVKWSRQLDRCVCAFGACQGCQTDQCKWLANCKGWPARGVLKAQEALSLEDVQQEARRALVWLDFALNGYKNGTARRPHFWVRFGNLSFPKIIFFGGLVFGAAWRSLFWSRLAASFL